MIFWLWAACATPHDSGDTDPDTADSGDTDTAETAWCTTAAVTFAPLDGEPVDVTTELTTGQYLTLDQPGTLHVCPGTWFAHVVLRASVVVQGEGAAPDDVVLSGGESGTILDVLGPDVTLEVRDLRLDRGAGLQVEHNSGGGGIYCEGDATVLGEDLRFTDNFANDGAGLYARECAVTLRRVEFADNLVDDDGGALTLWYSTATLEAVSFVRNRALDAGAFALFYSDATVTDGTFTDNEASHFAGAVWVYESTLSATASHFATNEGGEAGGAVLLAGQGTFADVTIEDNTSTQGGGIFVYWESTITATATTILGNLQEDLFVADYVNEAGGHPMEGQADWNFVCAANECTTTE